MGHKTLNPSASCDTVRAPYVVFLGKERSLGGEYFPQQIEFYAGPKMIV